MRRIAAVTVVALQLILAGCGGGDGPVDPVQDQPVVGTYQLESVDGQPLPFDLASIPDPPYDLSGVAIISGSLILREGGSFTLTTVSQTENATTGEVTTETDIEDGTYHRVLDEILFLVPGMGGYGGPFDGDSITIDFGLYTVTFRR